MRGSWLITTYNIYIYFFGGSLTLDFPANRGFFTITSAFVVSFRWWFSRITPLWFLDFFFGLYPFGKKCRILQVVVWHLHEEDRQMWYQHEYYKRMTILTAIIFMWEIAESYWSLVSQEIYEMSSSLVQTYRHRPVKVLHRVNLVFHDTHFCQIWQI